MLVLSVAAACGDSPTGNADPEPQPGPAPVASIDVTPGEAELNIGNWKQLAATPRARDGRALTGRAVAWTSSDTRIAIVDANGVVATVGAGIVFITATSEGQAAVARLVVNAPGRIVAVVRLGPPSVSLEVGASRFLTATAVDSNNYLVEGRPVAFASSDASIVSVDANGRITALRAGVAHITATIDGKSAQSRVEVVAPAPRVAGTWSVVIEELVGENTSCTIEGLAFALTQDGETLGGEIRGLDGGPRVACTVAGGNPPYVTPLPPLGRIVGRATAEDGGAVVTIQTEQGGWSFSGVMRDGVFVGRAALDVPRDGRVESRRGMLYGVKL